MLNRGNSDKIAPVRVSTYKVESSHRFVIGHRIDGNGLNFNEGVLDNI